MAKAPLISPRELPKLIDNAVLLASQRSKIAGAPASVVVRWDLVGRVVPPGVDAEAFARDVVSQLDKKAIVARPAVLKIDKQTIAGFFERDAVPPLRNL